MILGLMQTFICIEPKKASEFSAAPGLRYSSSLFRPVRPRHDGTEAPGVLPSGRVLRIRGLLRRGRRAGRLPRRHTLRRPPLRARYDGSVTHLQRLEERGLRSLISFGLER